MNPLSFSANVSEEDLRLAVLECGRICYARRLMTSSQGNISVRLGDDRALITPSGLSKGRMEAGDLIILDLDGKVLSAAAGRKPSSETPMHLEVYRQRADARAVIHAHPLVSTALTVAGLSLPADMLPEVLITLGEIPITEYATPSSHEDADAVRTLIRAHDALLLRQHGSLTVGKDLEQALVNLEQVEHAAEVFLYAALLGKVNRVPPETLGRLLRAREEYQSGK